MNTRYNALINQPIELMYQFYVDGAPADVYQWIEVKIYAVDPRTNISAGPIQVIPASAITRLGVGLYSYIMNPVPLSQNYYDQQILIPLQGFNQIVNVEVVRVYSMSIVPSSISIAPEDLMEIKSALGSTLIDQLEWGENTDYFVVNTIVKRVLRIYYSYFPIRSEETILNVAGEFELAYPSDNILRMLRHSFNYKTLNYMNFSPFILQTSILSKSPTFQSFENSQVQEAMMRMTTAESLVEFTKAVQVDDFPDLRKIKGFINPSGDLMITWAKKSDNFSDIFFNRKEDAIKLGKAFLLQEAARIRSQVGISSKVTLNVEQLKEDGNRWEQEVMDSWKGRSQAVMMKG